jgi:hypothetical protein
VETLPRESVLEDTQLFQDILENRFSYFFLEHGDYKKTLDTIRERASDLDKNTFGNLLQKVLTLFIDGHAQMSHVLCSSGDLPFMPEALGEKVLAVNLDDTAFVDSDYPYVTKLDGKDINEWAKLAQNLLPDVSPQFVRWRSVDLLRRIHHWRLELGQELKNTVEVELSDGEKTITKRLEVLPKSQPRPKRTEKESRLLENSLGYLRLAKMDDEAIETIRQWMLRSRIQAA